MPNRKQRPSPKKEKTHDAVFKAFFSDNTIAKNYLLHYTPSEIYHQIDFSHFQKSDTAFVSGRFGVSFSDIVYEARLKTGALARILFLFEHKSFVPSQPVHLQLLDYLLQIWEDDIKNKRPLSFIIPIVVYHGEQGWEQKSFTDYFKELPAEWQVFIPSFQYLLTDLSKIPPSVILEKRKSEYLRNLFLALKLARDEELVKKNWKKILTFGIRYTQDDRERILVQSLTLYLFNLFDMTQSEIKELSEDLPDPEHSWVDAIPEIFGERWKKAGLRKGRKEGLKLGRAEGIAQGKIEGKREGKIEGKIEGKEEQIQEFAAKTLKKFPTWSDEETAEFIGVTVEYIQKLRNELDS